MVAAKPQLIGNVVQYANGGNGGNGGQGGKGGLGGNGKIGGQGWGSSAPGGEGGVGGVGGRGGRGGRGGHGGDGSGGPSARMWVALGPADPTCIGNIYSQVGTPGLGGVGGTRDNPDANGSMGKNASVVNPSVHCLE